MSHLSQTEKILEFLKSNPNKKFTAREIAKAITSNYPEDYEEKRKNPRFKDEKSFISQIVAEIGAEKEQLLKRSEHIFYQDIPRPRVYWYNPHKARDLKDEDENRVNSKEVVSFSNKNILESDLYPLLIDYLSSEFELYSKRIDEKKSSNSRGKGGNTWLHPDIVSMQVLDREWNELVRSCVKNGGGQSVRLWSFEVKVELKSSNVRESFFQAVSNSSWANEGYLVATSISNSKVEQELRMLSSLHGIGVILLNVQAPSNSEIFLPAKAKPQIDWQSVNRILVENSDFKDYIELVSTYYQTGRVRKRDWDR